MSWIPKRWAWLSCTARLIFFRTNGQTACWQRQCVPHVKSIMVAVRYINCVWTLDLSISALASFDDAFFLLCTVFVVGDIRWARGCNLDRKHEFSSRRQQDALSRKFRAYSVGKSRISIAMLIATKKSRIKHSTKPKDNGEKNVCLLNNFRCHSCLKYKT